MAEGRHAVTATADGTEDGEAVARLVLHAAGAPTDPDAPMIEVTPEGTLEGGRARGLRDLDVAEALVPALRRLLETAAALGHERVLLGWDPMDMPGLRALEAAGFRTVGRQPYFPLGGGQVEYVSGYTDPTGAVVDLEARLTAP